MALILPKFNDGAPLRVAMLVLVSLRSIATGVQIPAVNSAIPQIVSEDLLMKANGINSTMQSVANFAAPAAAGVVMSVLTLRASMMIDVATAVVGIAILSFIFIPRQLSSGNMAASDFKADVRNGVRYSITNKSIGGILAVRTVYFPVHSDRFSSQPVRKSLFRGVHMRILCRLRLWGLAECLPVVCL